MPCKLAALFSDKPSGTNLCSVHISFTQEAVVLFRHDKSVDRDNKPQYKPLTETNNQSNKQTNKKSVDDGEYLLRRNVLMNTSLSGLLQYEPDTRPISQPNSVLALNHLTPKPGAVA